MLDANNYLGKMLAERYLLVRVIGHGASSAVFYAEDMMTKRHDGTPLPVAVKVLDRDSGEYKLNSKSFRTEINAVAGIPTSPHIIAVKDVSFFDDEHFIVMEYVSGKTLKDYIAERGGTLPAKEIVSIALQLLSALRYAHEVGVVHRDIKPQNIMVERTDHVGSEVDIPGGKDMPFVKLADFGIALLPDEDLFAMKERGVGTVHYISPEQASGESVDARSDLYSLGVVMYEMATGKVPFDAQSATGIISKHQIEMPFHVRTTNQQIPLELDQIIFTAMKKNPSDRFKDASAMEKKLKEVMRSLCVGSENRGDRMFSPAAIHVSGEGDKKKAPKPSKAPKAARTVKEAKPPKAPREGGLLTKGFLIGGVSLLLVAALAVGAVFLLPTLIQKTYDITVPNLIGTVFVEGATYADGVFVPQDKVTFAHSNEVEAGKVLNQTPSPGVVLNDVEKVDISLVVSLGPEMVDFSLPVEYRTDYETAKRYLEDINGPYPSLSVKRYEEAHTRNPSLPSGTVIGVYRMKDQSELLLDGDQIYKSLVEEIVLIVNPKEYVEDVVFWIPTSDARTEAGARAYLEENYSFLTLKADVVTEAVNPDDPQNSGTVVGIKLEDGTIVRNGELIAKEAQTVTLVVVE